MASSTLADYQILKPSTFTLEGNNTTQLLHLEIPSDFAHESGARRPLFAFKIKVKKDDSELKIFVNDHQVFHQSNFDRSPPRGYWEPFKTAGILNGADPGKVEVLFSCTEGAIQIDDVIFWYQVKRDG